MTIRRHVTTQGHPGNWASQHATPRGWRRLPGFSRLAKNACLPCSHGNIEAVTPYQRIGYGELFGKPQKDVNGIKNEICESITGCIVTLVQSRPQLRPRLKEMRCAVDKCSVIDPYDSAKVTSFTSRRGGCCVESPKCFFDNSPTVGGECLRHYGKCRAGGGKLICGARWNQRSQQRPQFD